MKSKFFFLIKLTPFCKILHIPLSLAGGFYIFHFAFCIFSHSAFRYVVFVWCCCVEGRTMLGGTIFALYTFCNILYATEKHKAYALLTAHIHTHTKQKQLARINSIPNNYQMLIICGKSQASSILHLNFVVSSFLSVLSVYIWIFCYELWTRWWLWLLLAAIGQTIGPPG